MDYIITVLLLMFLFHVFDDFGLQIKSLSRLKQKKYIEIETNSNQLSYKKYRFDYLIALLIHGLSWSIMIHLPIIIFIFDWKASIIVVYSILINAVIHSIIDDLKANRFKINLMVDQLIHFVQIIVTWYYFCIL